MTGSEDTPSVDTGAPARPARPGWADSLTTVGSAFYGWLIRPRVRLTVTGTILVLVGGLMATNSVWTLPLVIVGALMVAVAWMGRRLEGRFTVEWGDAGTQLAFNATIKAPAPALAAPAREASSSPPPAVAPPSPQPAAAPPPRADVIEGEAHTVEINVTELKALIAAAEAAEGAEVDEAGTAGTTATSPVSDIRIRRLAEDDARTPRPAG